MVLETESILRELEGIRFAMSSLEGNRVVNFSDCLRVMAPISESILEYNRQLGINDVDSIKKSRVSVLCTIRFNFSVEGEDSGVIEKLCKDNETGALFLDDEFIPVNNVGKKIEKNRNKKPNV